MTNPQAHDPATPPEIRPMSDDAIRQDLHEIKESIGRIEHTLNGNGRPGLKTRVAILEQMAGAASRLTWIVVTSALTAMASAAVVLFKLVIK